MSAMSVRQWARGVALLLSCAVGFSVSTLPTYAIGQFMQPLEEAFGWSRTQTSAGLSVALVLQFFIVPLIGRAVDLVNARWIAIPGLLLTGLALASFSLINSDLRIWLVLWGVLGLGMTLIGPIVWVTVAAAAFPKRRGLAMAMALSGTSIGSAFGPAVTRFMIDAHGWRDAYQLLALTWCGAALLLTVFFFFDRRVLGEGKGPKPTDERAEPKPSLRSEFLSPTFLKLAGVVFLVMVLLTAYLVHLSPALVADGIRPQDAAKIAGIYGVASLAGKLVAGWVFDRAPLVVVTTGVMGLLALGCVLLTQVGGDPGLALIACATVGAAAGAMYALMPCITMRLYQAEHFGVVYGVLTSFLSLAAALGPLVAAFIYDRYGSYHPGFWMGVPACAMMALVLATLKPAAPRLTSGNYPPPLPV